MSTNRRITAIYSRTYSIGDFESMKLGAIVTQDISDQEDSDKIYAEMFDDVLQQVTRVAQDVVPNINLPQRKDT